MLSGAGSANLAATPISRMDLPWWHARFIEKQAELHRGPVDLVWLGDSITQNWEKAGPEPWRDFAPIWQRFYGDRHAVNLGFKGDSTCHLLWRLQHGELDAIHPRLAILLIGANNFGHVHTGADQTYDGILAILDTIHRRSPETRVLLLGVLPSIRSAWVDTNTERLDDRLRHQIAAARPYVTYRDVGTIFRAAGRVDASKFLDPRLKPPDPPLHPTAQSAEQIAASIEPDVARIMGDRLHR